ncbi:Gas vesicle protein [Halobiforma haloterrestris]|uniref:Gas vesicle protein n=1 Tax=Natronobacterium haloterrestre TaxID=148448 RepID=A0A1I1JKR1_NATHA|nr:gas vesicle protein [Halobiforma haloterrestris]SFC48945.1 Gas vesicle protein [Halobiforma haloterrestris]
MRPRKDDEALVDVIDVLLRDGAVLRADVIVSVAEIPLVGIKLTAAIAGMETMTEYGFFEEWDVEHRRRHSDVAVGSNGRTPPSAVESADGGVGQDDATARIDRNDRENDERDGE